jgi:hypothetical protein
MSSAGNEEDADEDTIEDVIRFSNPISRRLTASKGQDSFLKHNISAITRFRRVQAPSI